MNQPTTGATPANLYKDPDFVTRPPYPPLHRRNNGPLHTNASLAQFTFFMDNIRNTRPTATFNLADAYIYLINFYARRQTEELRQLKNPQEQRQYKARNFAYCCFCGTFLDRSNDGHIKPSGLICLDFDHLENLSTVKTQLKNDPKFETQLLFTSPSGHGLKWVIQIKPQNAPHHKFFQAVSAYLKSTYKLEPDPSGKDIARACFLPYDPEAVINPKIIQDYERI